MARVLRETIQVGDEVHTYDLLLLVGEASKVGMGIPGGVTVISPWISNLPYYLGASGLTLAVPNVEFGKSDSVDLLQVIRTIMQDGRSNIKIATLEPSTEKYGGDSFYQVWELRFLVQVAESGGRIYFYKSAQGERKILHPKFLLTSLGVVFGSFNFTRAGRYSNIEDGNYASSTSPVYFEKKQRVEEIIRQCKEADVQYLRKLLVEFEGKTGR